MDPIVYLDEHWCRHNQRLSGCLDEAPTCPVIGIAAIQRSIERSGIEDQRHDQRYDQRQARGVGRSSAVRRAVSLYQDAPIPKLRGRGRWLFTFSSSASRITVAIEVPRSAATRRRCLSNSSETMIVVRCTGHL